MQEIKDQWCDACKQQVEAVWTQLDSDQKLCLDCDRLRTGKTYRAKPGSGIRGEGPRAKKRKRKNPQS